MGEREKKRVCDESEVGETKEKCTISCCNKSLHPHLME